MKKRANALCLILLMVVSLTCNLPPLWADDTFEEMSTQDMQYVRGLISRVSIEKMQISVRPPKGKLIRINIDPDTVLEGVSQIDEFKKEQQVKVWYSTENDSRKAIKVKMMMELGC